MKEHGLRSDSLKNGLRQPDALFEISDIQRAPSVSQESLARSEIREIAALFEKYCFEFSRKPIPIQDPSSDLASDSPGPEVVSNVYRLAINSIEAAVADLSVWASKALNKQLDHRSDFSIMRPVLESSCVAVWLLGPTESAERQRRALGLMAMEVREVEIYLRRLERIDPGGDLERRGALRSDLEKLRQIFRKSSVDAGFDPRVILSENRLTHAGIATESGAFVPSLSQTETYALWSVCSGIVHAQPYYATQFSDVSEVVFADGATVQTARASAYATLRFVHGAWAIFLRATELFNLRNSPK